MSSYFDALQREVREAADRHEDDAAFLEAVSDIEGRMYADVTAITGDREFPDEMREKMLGVLATVAVYQPTDLPIPERARELVLRCRYSRAVEDMHELHHDLARRVLDRCTHRVMVPTAFCMNLAATVNVVLYDRLAKGAGT